MYTEFLLLNLMEVNHLEELYMDEGHNIKVGEGGMGGRVGTGFFGCRTGTSGGLLSTWQ